jgi:gas vesicle protein
MARNDGGAAGSVIMSFVLGAFAGAAVALLMAPATGDEMRRKLAEKAREGAEKASEAARQGREFVEQQRGSVAEAIERGREAYHQAKTAGVTPPPSTTPSTPSTPIKPGGAAL